MKQIVDKLNKIAKKINENVELSDRDLIIDSLDSITKAYGGTPNDSTLIVDKLDDIYNNIGSAPSGNIEITENTAEGESLDVSQYATATVNVAGGGGRNIPLCTLTVIAPVGTGNPNVIYWIAFVDNILQKQYLSEGPNTLLMPYTEDDGITISGLDFDPNRVFEFSNPVNIDLSDDWPFIIDETKDSSLTVTVTSWGGGI